MNFAKFFTLLFLMTCACSKTPLVESRVTTGSGLLTHGLLGGEKQNGADSINEANSGAWFINHNYPQICMVIDPKFGASRESIIDAITQAAGKWNLYLTVKGIQVPIARLGWIQYFECQGHEDLKFYFGARSPEVDAAASGFTNPVAFAHRTSRDLKTGMSKGFVWIASQGSLDNDSTIYPDWSQKYNLVGILTHELGHVYGVDHVPHTIMDERVADFLKLGENQRKERLEEIDSFRDLYICVGCPVSRSGFLGFSEKQDPGLGAHSDSANFQLLTGRAPTGPIVARVEGSFTRSLSLRIDDFISSSTLQIDLDNGGTDNGGLTSEGESEGIFRVVTADESGKVKVTAIKRGSRVLYGSLKTLNGEILPVTIELNMSTRVSLNPSGLYVDGLVIKAFKDGRPRILFFSVAY